MRILLSNKFYYLRGGVDIFTIELERLLKERGHKVAVFSMQHSLNLETGYSEYFPGEIDLTRVKVKNLISTVIRPFGSKEVRKKFNKLLEDFNPEIVHLNNIHSQLSPILMLQAKRHNIPVVWTLHDHKLLCPRYDCMRDNNPCELCFYNKINVLKYRCMKNNFFASLLAYAEAVRWNKKVISRNTDQFICPSLFLKNNMIKGGFAEEKLATLPNFINDKKLNRSEFRKQDFYCYVGRLSVEKGIETLLKAAIRLPQYHLKVIGTGPLEEMLRTKYKADHIEFLGFKRWGEFRTILGESRCMVIPSECYENNPLSIIESLCVGTPVIGSDIGGIPELINEGRNGLKFEPGNINHLTEQINNLLSASSNYNYSEIASESRKKYNSENFYWNLLNIYNKVVEKHIKTDDHYPDKLEHFRSA
jgi:glycosyltransferase involved in cell wall biosynthesis